LVAQASGGSEADAIASRSLWGGREGGETKAHQSPCRGIGIFESEDSKGHVLWHTGLGRQETQAKVSVWETEKKGSPLVQKEDQNCVKASQRGHACGGTSIIEYGKRKETEQREDSRA
jgi:hypothetical protein